MQEEKVLGAFQDSETAAKAFDVAYLRIHGNNVKDEDLNFPKANYEQSQLEGGSVAEYLAALASFGDSGQRRNSRYSQNKNPHAQLLLFDYKALFDSWLLQNMSDKSFHNDFIVH